jgi:hypothetical protein
LVKGEDPPVREGEHGPQTLLSHAVNLFDMHVKYADVISLDETVGYLESATAGA